MNIMESENSRKDWPVSVMCWYAVLIWFGASLFSQVAYLAIYGSPYDANMLIDAAGPFAWLIIGIEILVWVIMAVFIGKKVSNRIQFKRSETQSVDAITPQT